MKRRIIWLVILPWRSGLYFLLDGMLWRQLTFEWVPRGDRSMISPASGGDFLLPCWLFWRALPAAGFLLNITGENTSDFENFMFYLLMCWQVFIYLRCLLAWNYCCCTSELWIYTTVCWLHYYFISVELILKVANPCIYYGCKFVRLIFLLIFICSRWNCWFYSFVFKRLSSNAAPFVHLKCEP